ncbi:hypothetical protein BJ165DRAFT_1615875 [Panaeolus papilionaceus]|nr:hypothetical protein BJ165DRAFT_1615875 [Panaeolus papilionaceus]
MRMPSSRPTLQRLQTDTDIELSGSESPSSTTSTSTLSSFSSFTSSSTPSIAQSSSSLSPPTAKSLDSLSSSNTSQSPKYASSSLPKPRHAALPSPTSAMPSRSHRTAPTASRRPKDPHHVVAGSPRTSRKYNSKPYDRPEREAVASAKKTTPGHSAPDCQSVSKKKTFEDQIEQLTGHRPRSYTTPPPPHVREAARARRMCWDASNDFAAQYSTLPLCPGPLETSPAGGDEWLASDVYYLL